MAIDVILSSGLILSAALIIDAISGEPVWFYKRIPHPVVLMSGLLMRCEKQLNIPDWSPLSRRLGGVLIILCGCLLMYWIGIGIQSLLLPVGWGNLVLALIVSTLLAGRSLYDHVRNVEQTLISDGPLDEARKAVGQIIGRNTAELDEPAISRAAIESLSENFSDGIVAPAFWFLVAGLPGILIYKLVNTADSMIGYRSERYIDFGWAAARLDDLMNLIPARLTSLLFAIAAVIWGRTSNVLATAWRDAKHHASPNAGWPEAAMAGALDLRLGGPRHYPGNVINDGAWLGSGGEATPVHITHGLRLALISWGIMLGTIIVWGLQ